MDGGTVGSSLIEASLWRSASGVLGVPTDICDSCVMKKKKFSHCYDLGLIERQSTCQD